MSLVETKSDRKETRTFFVIWFGQLISLVGSNMTSFGLGVWISQTTGSVTQYAITILCTLVPTSLISPFAGAIVDRFDRRKIMIISDTMAGFSSLFIAVMFFTQQLQVTHIYIAAIVTAAAGTFQTPAYQATITLLVPKEQYRRAAGLLQLSEALGLLIAPPLAGLLLVTIRLEGIILLDFSTLFFSLFTLFRSRFPVPVSNGDPSQPRPSILKEVFFGLKFILKWPGFMTLTFYVVFFMQLLFGFALALITPLVLSFANEAVFGIVVGVVGLGALAGGILTAVWEGPKKRTNGILMFAIPYALSLILGGLLPDARLVAFAGFLLAISHAMVSGFSRVLWQVKVAPEIQGRVFSTRLLIAVGAQAIGTLMAGPLADRFFGPMMMPDGALAGSIGKIIGVGEGRGIGLMFIILGILAFIGTFVAFLNPYLRHLERDMPDHSGSEVPIIASSS